MYLLLEFGNGSTLYAYKIVNILAILTEKACD